MAAGEVDMSSTSAHQRTPVVGAAETAPHLRAIRQLERAKAQLEVMQALLEEQYARAQIHAQREAGVPREHVGRGVADEISLARRTSPKRAGDQLAVRRVLGETMPRIFDQVLAGDVQPWAAEQVAQVALVLDDQDRDRLDAELAPRIVQLTPASAKGAARRIADRLDQDAASRRLERNEAQRYVSIRPAADGMVRLCALLPTRAGVAVHAALTKLAAAAPATGETRSKGQLMADELVERVTGRETPTAVPIQLQLLMTDRTLLAHGTDTALLDGMPIPAEAALALALATSQELSSDGPGIDTNEPRRYLRRLFTDPATGNLTDMDVKRRAFTGAVRTFITARDQRCRIPHCDAAIRDIDHVTRYADGGETHISNGAGPPLVPEPYAPELSDDEIRAMIIEADEWWRAA